jgi:hypothetical protein
VSEGGIFNIGSQHAATINVAGRDQVVGAPTGAPGALEALAALRDALAGLPLDAARRRHAEAALLEAEAELRAERPDTPRVAQALQRVADVAAPAGAFAGGTEAVLRALRHLAGWLGAAGAALL